jgi:DMSO reductase anchor subunit
MGPSLVVLGFIALSFEAGRPLKAIHLLRNLRNAWLSRETLFAIVFVSTSIVDWLILLPFFRIVAFLSGFAFITSQGLILYQILAIKNWNVPAIPIFFISSGCASGAGVFLLTATIENHSMTIGALMIAMTAFVVNLLSWSFYLHALNSHILNTTTGDYPQSSNRNTLIAFGHAFPLLFLFALIVWQTKITASIESVLTALSGLIILASVNRQKFIIIFSVSTRKEITIQTSLS